MAPLFQDRKKGTLFLLATLIVLFVCVSIPLFLQVEMNMSQDAYWYMALAKNISEKGTYSSIDSIPHLKYPPGFPLLVALVHKIAPDYLLASRLTAYVFGVLTILLAFVFGRKISPLAGLISAFCAASFALLVNYSLFGMTETSFVFFSFIGALLVLDNKRATRREKVSYLFGFALIGFSILIRYTGVVTLFAVVLLEWLKDRKSGPLLKRGSFWAAGLAIAILVALPWLSWVSLNAIQDGIIFKSDYLSQKKPFNPVGVGEALLNLNPILLVAVVISIWFYAKSKLGNRLLDFLILFFIGFLILHSWWGWTNFRFFTVLIIVVSVFLAFLCHQLAQKKRFETITVLLVVYLVIQVALFDSMEENYYSNSFNLIKIKEASGWMTENIPPSSALVVADIPIYNYYLHRQELENIFEYDSLGKLLASNRDVWISVDGSHPWASVGIVQYNPDRVTVSEDRNGQAITREYSLEFVKGFAGDARKTPLLKSDYYIGFVRLYHVKGPIN
jgi:4-amino-4-deoxy-L-arabinose transferase-like glycosyltransferase